MKFICTQENLKRGLSLVSHLAGKNQNLPILNNVLLEVKNGLICLSTTNLEIGIKTKVRGKVEREGSLTVPAKILSDYIQSIRGEKIELIAKENNLEIKTENSETVLKGLDYSEFPLIPEIEKKYSATFIAEDLKESLNLVLFATASDTARPEISGVLFNFNKDKLILAATDSYRLAEKIINTKTNIESNKKIIIPLFTLQELNRLIGEIEKKQEIIMNINDNQVSFENDTTVMISRITEGEYPDYKHIIPQTEKTKATLNRILFQQSIKAASLFCRQGINDISLFFYKDKVEIRALNDQLGESKTFVEGKIEGEKNQIIFNYHYLLDALSSLNDSEIIIKINNPETPGLLIPTKRSDYLYIIMPIKQ